MRRIEKRGAVNVLCDDYGCSPATKAEAEFFDEIERLRAEVEALRADADDAARYRYVNGPNGWIEKLRVAVEDLTADRDSWRDQASARAADAVRFMQERDAARAEVEALRADAERLDCGQIMIDTRDEFGEPKQVWHTGMNLRAAIDAARAAREGRG